MNTTFTELLTAQEKDIYVDAKLKLLLKQQAELLTEREALIDASREVIKQGELLILEKSGHIAAREKIAAMIDTTEEVPVVPISDQTILDIGTHQIDEAKGSILKRDNAELSQAEKELRIKYLMSTRNTDPETLAKHFNIEVEEVYLICAKENHDTRQDTMTMILTSLRGN